MPLRRVCSSDRLLPRKLLSWIIGSTCRPCQYQECAVAGPRLWSWLAGRVVVNPPQREPPRPYRAITMYDGVPAMALQGQAAIGRLAQGAQSHGDTRRYRGVVLDQRRIGAQALAFRGAANLVQQEGGDCCPADSR